MIQSVIEAIASTTALFFQHGNVFCPEASRKDSTSGFHQTGQVKSQSNCHKDFHKVVSRLCALNLLQNDRQCRGGWFEGFKVESLKGGLVRYIERCCQRPWPQTLCEVRQHRSRHSQEGIGEENGKKWRQFCSDVAKELDPFGVVNAVHESAKNQSETGE